MLFLDLLKNICDEIILSNQMWYWYRLRILSELSRVKWKSKSATKSVQAILCRLRYNEAAPRVFKAEESNDEFSLKSRSIDNGGATTALLMTTCENTEEKSFDEPSIVTPYSKEVRMTERNVASESRTEVEE